MMSPDASPPYRWVCVDCGQVYDFWNLTVANTFLRCAKCAADLEERERLETATVVPVKEDESKEEQCDERFQPRP